MMIKFKPVSATFFSLYFILATIYLLYSVKEFERNTTLTSHTIEVIAEAQKLFSYIKDSEIWQRGYLLTGDSLYLSPFNEATKNIFKTILELEDLTSENIEQQVNVSLLKKHTINKVKELSDTVNEYNLGNNEKAIDIVLSGLGIEEMKKISSRINTIIKIEEGLLLKIKDNKEDRIAKNKIVIYINLAISILMFLIFSFRGYEA